jgi:hypothetical protein
MRPVLLRLPGKRARLPPRECSRAPATTYAQGVPLRRFGKGRATQEPAVSVGDPRVADWETVSEFEDERTAVAWRDHLRGMGIDAACVADQPLDRLGRGDVYLVVPPEEWSRANEIVENLD